MLFKADLIFKDFSRKSSKFKYFSSLCEPCAFLCTALIFEHDRFKNDLMTVLSEADPNLRILAGLSSNFGKRPLAKIGKK